MKVIVVGATGFIGRALVERLLNQNTEVIVLIRDKKELVPEWESRVTFVICPEDRIKDLQQYCTATNIDIFYNLAWHGVSGELRKDYDIQINNIRYCCDAVIAASKLKCKRYVYAGSIMEYEAMQFVKEQGAVPSPNTLYSTAKLSADFMTKIVANSVGIEYVGLLISNIYGEGEKPGRFLNTVVRTMLCNETINMTKGTQMYDFIHISDAVDEIILAAERGTPNNAYYIGNSSQRPLREFVLEIKDILNSKSLINFGAVVSNQGTLQYTEFDTKQVESEFGYVPKVSFKQGIKRLADSILKRDENQ